MTDKSAAVQHWQNRIGAASDAVAGTGQERLPPPSGLTATVGAGHVTLDWEPVAGAIGYLVHRAPATGGDFEPVDHLGGDVLAVPAPPYADTTVTGGESYRYAVASWAEAGAGELSDPVRVPARSGPAGTVTVAVDVSAPAGQIRPVWRRMIGSEHLSLLNWQDTGKGGNDIRAEFTQALQIAHDDLGVEYVRAHGTFLPEMVSFSDDLTPDFTGLDLAYDKLLALGLKPVVELSFMPRELARDASKTVFEYAAIISPPRSWQQWHDLNRALMLHLVDRYGLNECRTWLYEVWNEANLEVFWDGTQAEYHRLYAEAARAIKSVDPGLRVGGPGSAAAKWVTDLLAYCRQENVPIDFVSTHTYGNAPLDYRPVTAAHAAAGHPEPEIWWTEWGVTPTHFHPVSDAVFSAPFVLRGMKAALESTDALAYWVISDHFEELGWPPRLFHGGFGLLTVGNLRKPRYWALHLLNQLGPQRVAATITGDGAGSLVDALATRAADGTVRILIWNGTLDQGKTAGSAELDRTVSVTINGLGPEPRQTRITRLDVHHGNIIAAWEKLGSPDWPDAEGWIRLRQADVLEPEPAGEFTGSLRLTLPMPGIALVELIL